MNKSAIHRTFSLLAVIAVGLLVLIADRGETAEPVSDKSYWVYFSDKGDKSGSNVSEMLANTERDLTPRAFARRNKLNRTALVDFQDIPVESTYIFKITAIEGVRLRTVSRWLNAISISASPDALQAIASLDFVERIAPVAVGRKPIEPAPELLVEDQDLRPPRDNRYDYGISYRQNTFMNLPELHDRGYLGQGILIGVCDAGFDNLDHTCFSELRLVATRDFVNGDNNVGNEGDRGSGQHGTRTLSIMAGFDEGHLIGAAPHASYALAKTENTEDEEQVEEDYWVAGVEWLDSLGVDIISSSLGYIDWYDFEDLDGETGITTIAANRAVEVGIVVVNSMGNSGFNNYPLDKMVTPADGFDVFSIGATGRDSLLAGFSSIGPTFDGRIKPDFVTFGSSVVIASSVDDNGYAAGGGTSFSAPAVAGLCALLIEADPYLTPLRLKELLQNSSDRGDSPDTLYGWGVPNALTALQSIEPIQTELVIPLHQGWNTISQNLSDLEVRQFPDYFQSLVDANRLLFVKDEHGRFFAPALGFNLIPNWDRLTGYQVCMSEPDELRFEGSLCDYTQPIFLPRGWHIVAYLPNFELPVDVALATLTDSDDLIMVKDEWGRFYYPRRRFNNMGNLIPGRGYHMKLEGDGRLAFPRTRLDSQTEEAPLKPAHFIVPDPAQSGMSLLLLAEENVSDGDEAAFFDQKGKVIGSGIFIEGMCGIALWGGETSTALPAIKFWSHQNQIEQEVRLTLEEGVAGYKPDGMLVMKISIALPENPNLQITHFPEPFNSRLTVKVDNLSRPFELSVHDLSGRQVFHQSFAASQHLVEFNATDWPSGIYQIRLKSGEIELTRKVICLK